MPLLICTDKEFALQAKPPQICITAHAALQAVLSSGWFPYTTLTITIIHHIMMTFQPRHQAQRSELLAEDNKAEAARKQAVVFIHFQLSIGGALPTVIRTGF